LQLREFGAVIGPLAGRGWLKSFHHCSSIEDQYLRMVLLRKDSKACFPYLLPIVLKAGTLSY
jgi:hypothetical protein